MNQDRPGTIEIPVRYNNPTKYDIAQYGALSKVVRDDGSMELFIQTSPDIDQSAWMTVGELIAQTDCIDVESLGDALCQWTDIIEPQKRHARETLLMTLVKEDSP